MEDMGVKQKQLSVEHKRKIGLANKGKVRTFEVKKRISHSLKTKYKAGLKAGFQKGHKPFNN